MSDAVKTSGKALLSLIDEILDFSKIEAGRLDLAGRALRPPCRWSRAWSSSSPRAPRARASRSRPSSRRRRAAPRVVGDADRLRQILVNLAGNAVKFTEAGGVGVSVERGAAGGSRLRCHDTGPGIPQDRVPSAVRGIRAGRRQRQPAARRHRPRPRHHPPHRRAHGRARSRSIARSVEGVGLPRPPAVAGGRRHASACRPVPALSGDRGPDRGALAV